MLNRASVYRSNVAALAGKEQEKAKRDPPLVWYLRAVEKAPKSRQSLDDYMGVLEKSVCVSAIGKHARTFELTHSLSNGHALTHTHSHNTHSHTHSL